MDEERVRRARAEAQLANLQDDLERLEAERERLLAKNERLMSVLYVLRDRETDDVVRDLIEDALGFDGRSREIELEGEPSFDMGVALDDEI
jgi:predicted nuclease with TOPRIM domain